MNHSDLHLPYFSISSFTDYAITSQRRKKSQLYKLFWIRQGKGFFNIDLERYPISNETIHLLLPGTPGYLETHPELDGYVVEFNLPFLFLSGLDTTADFIKQATANGVTCNHVTTIQEPDKIEFLIESMRTEYTKFGLSRSKLLGGWLAVFVLCLPNSLTAIPTGYHRSKSYEVATKFYSLLEQHFYSRKSVTDYAKELHIAPEHLTFIVKQVSGHPASHHIKQRIILEAKRLALYSGESMKEIAYRLGFDEPAHFSKFFKTYGGKNFSDFKKSCSPHLDVPGQNLLQDFK